MLMMMHSTFENHRRAEGAGAVITPPPPLAITYEAVGTFMTYDNNNNSYY